MRIEKIFPNFEIIMWKKMGKRKISLTFYSDRTVDEVSDYLSSRLKTSYNSTSGLRMMILKKGHKGKTIDLNYHLLPIEDVKFHVHKSLMRMKGFVSVKQTRFQIIVRNRVSQQNDSRVTTFNSSLRFNEIVTKAQKVLEKKIEKMKKDDVIFHFTKNVKSTHNVTITHAGTLERRKKNSKTFSICVPNYSSREVIDLLREDK